MSADIAAPIDLASGLLAVPAWVLGVIGALGLILVAGAALVVRRQRRARDGRVSGPRP